MSCSNKQKRQFLAELQKFIEKESEITNNALLMEWEKPVLQKLATGVSLKIKKIEKSSNTKEIIAHFDENNSRYRENDLVCLHTGDALNEQFGRQITLIGENKNSLTLFAMDRDNIFSNYPGGVCFLDPDTMDLTTYYQQAIVELAETYHGREHVLPILMEKIENHYDFAAYDHADKFARSNGCNEAQTEAVASAFSSSPIYCIQGPPGTGKTMVLSQLVQLLVENGERVLITSHTHMAINNAINKVYERGINVIKIGSKYQCKTLNKKIVCHEEISEADLPENAYAIGATPFATCTKRLKGYQFDTIIFDEASQITVVLAAMAMRVGKKYIFLGDHYQLPPIVKSHSVLDDENRSVFAMLVQDDNINTMLEETYRMNDSLTKWPNKTFYQNRLFSSLYSKNRRLCLPHAPNRFSWLLAPEHCMIFIPTNYMGARTSNLNDAIIIADICNELIKCGLLADEIGIVTPYRAQGRLLKNIFKKRLGQYAVNAIVTDTVERMQGQQREVIFLSLVTSDLPFAQNIATFYFQPQRLNVSVTRAKTKLIILGNKEIANWQSDNNKIDQWLSYYKDMLNCCLEIKV